MFDVLVIGAGFGGLSVALRARELGARVALVERLKYPGGCASTFKREGALFDAGATLSSGLGEGQLFRRWIQTYSLDVQTRALDPVIEMRGTRTTNVWAEKARFVRELGASDDVTTFFARQQSVADALWPLLEDARVMPPLKARHLGALIRRAPSLARFAPWVAKPLARILPASLKSVVDPILKITVQCTSEDAETLSAMSALDYPWRGTAHVQGGIGALAWGLARAFEQLGGQLRFAHNAKSIARDGRSFVVRTSKGDFRAARCVLNCVPDAAHALFHEVSPGPAGTWGAVMLYARARTPRGAPVGAHHLQLVHDEHAPLEEGNHVFVSISGEDERRAPQNERTLTASTHLSLARYEADPASRASAALAALKATLKKRAPEWCDFAFEMSGSPRTFERFLQRPLGVVGGAPRTADLRGLLFPRDYEVARDVFLVGDAMSPGQSTYAVAAGGVRVAERMARGF